MTLHLLFRDLDLKAFVPRHVLGGLVQVITFESTHWDKRDLLRLVTDFGEHFVDLTLDLFVSVLAPVYRFIIHFVDAHNDLFNSQKMAQSCMLTGLSLDLTFLVVSFWIEVSKPPLFDGTISRATSACLLRKSCS